MKLICVLMAVAFLPLMRVTPASAAGEGRPRGLALVEEIASAASPLALDPPLSRASAL